MLLDFFKIKSKNELKRLLKQKAIRIWIKGEWVAIEEDRFSILWELFNANGELKNK